MKKLFLTITLALLFMTPAFADSSDHTGAYGGGGGGSNPSGITRVQQVQAQLVYYQHELTEYAPGSPRYVYSQRYVQRIINKQLPQALAAAASGNPLPPITDERGNVQPLLTIY